jgi:hypothetical protein
MSCNSCGSSPTVGRIVYDSGSSTGVSIGPTNAPLTIPFLPATFCWKCFLFWALITVGVLALLYRGRE